MPFLHQATFRPLVTHMIRRLPLLTYCVLLTVVLLFIVRLSVVDVYTARRSHHSASHRTVQSIATILAANGQHVGATDQRQLLPLHIPRWIHDYTLWHAAALAKPDQHDFLVYHCTAKDSFCGGIGDRIRGMLALFYIAMVSRRVFLIDYAKPFPLTDTLSENLVQWSFPVPGGRKRRIHSIDKDDAVIVEPLRLRNASRLVLVRYNYFSDELLWKSAAMRQYLGKYQNMIVPVPPPPQLFKWAFHALFRKSALVQRQLDALRIGLTLDEPYVGVHIRSGNATTWRDPLRHRLEETDAFLQCARRMQAVVAADTNSSAPLIFVASDNQAVKERCRANEKAVRTAETVIYQIDRSKRTLSARAGNVDAWTEMFMLAEANCVVASRSHYSQVAVAISVREPAGGRCWTWFDECDDVRIGDNLVPPDSQSLRRPPLMYLYVNVNWYVARDAQGRNASVLDKWSESRYRYGKSVPFYH